jgi:hypothetical protein
MLKAIVIVTALLLSACGRTIPFKDGAVSTQQQHDGDYNVCVQEASPLYPIKWIRQPYWVSVPVYGYRMRDGRTEQYFSHYQSEMRLETRDVNEGARDDYVTRCMSSKGYTYRYLSKEELEARGLD